MSFSQSSATNFVPFLARLVLGAVFVIAGWNKLMTEHDFTPAETATLRAAGVVEADGSTSSAPATPDAEESPAGGVTTRSLHRITVMCQESGLPYAPWLGWATMATELVGGGLLIVGLFSRIWGLGLAIVMGFAFYLTSLPVLRTTSPFALPPETFLAAALQLSLLVLAIGVALAGPGGASLDRAIFGRAKPALD